MNASRANDTYVAVLTAQTCCTIPNAIILTQRQRFALSQTIILFDVPVRPAQSHAEWWHAAVAPLHAALVGSRCCAVNLSVPGLELRFHQARPTHHQASPAHVSSRPDVPMSVSNITSRLYYLLPCIDASFRKAHQWKSTDKQYKFDDLLSEVDSKLFACSKVESHCLHHMLPSRSACSQMALRPCGHSFDVPRVVYELTKRSFIMRSLYRDNSVML